VVAKWVLPESDSPQAHRLITEVALKGERLIILDLALIEVTNAIWKRQHRSLCTLAEAKQFLDELLRSPVHVESSAHLLPAALEIAATYQRPVYDTLFVALSREMGLVGVTADEPLHQALHADFAQVVLLRDWQPGSP
jgi:predicted nucleic acid-binding protein